jgi:alkylhydroperoxidase family enzyme
MSIDDRHAILTQMLVATVLTQPGTITPQLRTQIEAYTAQFSRSTPDAVDELPAELYNYVKKVALHAYKVTDDDISFLLQAGYTEDAIFEITVSAALGTGMGRLQRGLTLLKRGNDAHSSN